MVKKANTKKEFNADKEQKSVTAKTTKQSKDTKSVKEKTTKLNKETKLVTEKPKSTTDFVTTALRHNNRVRTTKWRKRHVLV